MTIIHISSAKTWRGGEQQIAYLLVELAERKIQQIMLCPVNSPLHLFCEKQSIPVKTFAKRSGVDLGLAWQLTRLCRRSVRPIIHVHDSQAHTAAFISATLWMNKTPVIIHRRVGFPLKKSFLTGLKYNHHSISRIICVSEYVREHMNAVLANTGKTVTVYDGIDLTKFQGKTKCRILKERFNFSDKHILIGNTSAITEEKDYFTFIDTADILLRNHDDLRFFIIGDGSQKQIITDYIEEKGLSDKILLTGFVNNIQDILPELDLFLFTSVMEGLGTSLLDAFACRIPVVSTNAGGIPEIVKDHITGLVVGIKKPAEMAIAVEAILTNPELKHKLVENAYVWVQEFSVKNIASEIIDIYNKVK